MIMNEQAYKNLVERIERFDKNRHTITVSKLLHNHFLVRMLLYRKLEKKDTVIYKEQKIASIISKISTKFSATKSLLITDTYDYYIDDDKYQELLSKYFNNSTHFTNETKMMGEKNIAEKLSNIDDDLEDLEENPNKNSGIIRRNDFDFVFLPSEYFISNKIDRYNIIDVFANKIKKININI